MNIGGEDIRLIRGCILRSGMTLAWWHLYQTVENEHVIIAIISPWSHLSGIAGCRLHNALQCPHRVHVKLAKLVVPAVFILAAPLGLTSRNLPNNLWSLVSNEVPPNNVSNYESLGRQDMHIILWIIIAHSAQSSILEGWFAWWWFPKPGRTRW